MNTMAKDLKRREWWRSLDAASQAAWFRKQRLIKEKGGKVKFDDNTIEETETTKALNRREMIWDKVPWLEYLKEQYALKRDYKEAVDHWNADLMDEDIPSEQLPNGVQLVGIFRGLRDATGTEDSSEVGVKRRRTVAASENPELEMETGRAKIAQCSKKAVTERAPSAVDAPGPEEQVPNDMIATPMYSPQKSHLMEELVRDLKEQRKAQQMQEGADNEDRLAIQEFHAQRGLQRSGGNIKNITEFRTSLVNINTSRALRLENNLKVAVNQSDSLGKELTQLIDSAGDSATESAKWKDFLATLNGAISGAKVDVKTAVDTCSIQKLHELTTVEEMLRYKDSCKEAEESVSNGKKGGKLGELKQLLRQITKAVSCHTKSQEELAAKGATTNAVEFKLTITDGISAFGDTVRSMAVPSGLAPSRSAFDTNSSAVKLLPKKQIATLIAASAVWQNHCRWVSAKMEKDSRSTCVADFSGAASGKAKLESHIVSNFGGIEWAKLELDGKESWTSGVFALQTWHTVASSVNCGAAPWGLKQGLLQVSGSEVVAGIKWEQIDGDGPKAKREHVLKQSGDDLNKLFSKEGGFMVRMLPGEMLLIPSGVCLLQITRSDASAGIRFSVAPNSEQEALAIATFMESLISDFPSLSNAAHQAWLKVLKAPLKFSGTT